MYIDYYVLNDYISNLLNEGDNPKKIFELIDSCSFIDDIKNNIKINAYDNKYILYYIDNYIGCIKSDYNYNIESKTALNLLKYLLVTDVNSFNNFISSLININNYKILKSKDEKLKVKLELNNKRNLFSINDDISGIDCDMKYYVYSDKLIIGMFNYNGSYYVTNRKYYIRNVYYSVRNSKSIVDNMNLYNARLIQGKIKEKCRMGYFNQVRNM